MHRLFISKAGGGWRRGASLSPFTGRGCHEVTGEGQTCHFHGNENNSSMRGPETFQTERARNLRRAMTEAEEKLWSCLRNRRLNGHKFVRQEPIGPYFADFCCRERHVVLEADGSQHADNPRDAKRDAFIAAQGYRIVRFWNHEILGNIGMVEDTILAALDGTLDDK